MAGGRDRGSCVVDDNSLVLHTKESSVRENAC
jgi:hypothetical protein